MRARSGQNIFVRRMSSSGDRLRPWDRKESAVKYILMMNTMKLGVAPFPGWSHEDIQRMIGYMMDLNRSLKQEGVLVGAEGLAFPEEAKQVRAGKDGKPVTDGVFPESKEFLAGYWIVEVDSPQKAYEIAARASACPGGGGEPLNMPIEVRQVMSGPPEEFV